MSIEVKNLNKAFGEKVALVDLNLSFEEGKITCLMGPSGCGKTTLFNILLGIYVKDSGQIIGLEDKKISAVFQEDRLLESFDAVENILAVTKDKLTKEQIIAEFAKLDLVECEGKKVSLLSGGMKRRVAIMRALLAESDLILMDEPLKGLDEALKEKTIGYIKEKSKGKTVIIITHEQSEVNLLSEKVLLMEEVKSSSTPSCT